MSNEAIVMEWIDKRLNNLFLYEEKGLAIRNFSDEKTAAILIIKCLSNANCEDSDLILNEIIKQRNK